MLFRFSLIVKKCSKSSIEWTSWISTSRILVSKETFSRFVVILCFGTDVEMRSSKQKIFKSSQLWRSSDAFVIVIRIFFSKSLQRIYRSQERWFIHWAAWYKSIQLVDGCDVNIIMKWEQHGISFIVVCRYTRNFTVVVFEKCWKRFRRRIRVK